MKRKTMISRKIVAAFLCVVMIAGLLNVNLDFTQGVAVTKGITAKAAEPVESSKEEIKEGAILQAFCWSFNTIKEKMPDIAAAGYTSIQTSPIQECLSTYPEMTIGGNGHWYYHYQPTDFTIGNYQLGSEEEFKSMCQSAHSYGIKVIVDAVPNHTAVDTTQVSQNLINAVGGLDKLYHSGTGLTNSSNYSDRLECTRYAIGNLPDIDTENTDYQNYFINFLNKCIEDGADGFRYDSAKHIGLPGDPVPDGVTNNFWERVTTEITNADDIFNYGEVLQGSNERLADYVNAIGATTASSYGANIRTALVKNNFLVSNIAGYAVDDSVNPDNLVTWVESHDNYYNDGTWSQLDNVQVTLGWAIIAARANGTPLFFSRPYGSSTTNEYGTNTIGAAGDDNYKDDQVVAANKFRNAMAGEPEKLTNPDGNAQILMIERGTKGVVIVNGSNRNYSLDTKTDLADGTYISHTDDRSVFTVINGNISGILPARAAVVLYGAEAFRYTTVHFYNDKGWNTVYAYACAGNDEIMGADPGTQAANDGGGWWRVTVPEDVVNGFTITFNNGAEGKTNPCTVNDGTKLYYANDAAYSTKAEAEAAIGIAKTTVHFFNSGSWSDVSAYVYGPGELLGTWPGTGAINEGDGWWDVDIPSAPADNLHVIFNNNGGGSQSSDFVISDPAKVYVTNENDKVYTSKAEAQTDIDMLPGTTVVYFYNNLGWDKVYAYVWGNAESLGKWPGTAAADVGDGWWKVAVPEDPSMNLHIIFNNNKGSQTGSIVISDITNRYTSSFNDKTYSSKAALLEANGVSNTETTVYFYNYKHWDHVYAYASKDGELLGTYPGTEAKKLQNYWWSITIPSGAADNLTVSFNDGSADNHSDTFTVNDKVKVYFTGYDAAGYSSRTAAETAMGVPLTTTTVYFYNSSGWAAVSAYLYGDSTAYGGWPGAAAAEVGNGWWKTDIPAPASSNLHVIFNNGGNGAQSADFVIDDTTHTYTTNFNGVKYTSIQEAETAVITGVVTPSAITGLPNGTARTATALSLPATVTLKTRGADVTAGVTWDLEESGYVPANTGVQTFTVYGRITLPSGMVNPDNISLTTSISVTVNAYTVSPVITQPAAPASAPGDEELQTPIKLGDENRNGMAYIIPETAVKERIANAKGLAVSIPIQLPEAAGKSLDIIVKKESLKEVVAAGTTITFSVIDKNKNELYAWSFDRDSLARTKHEMKDINLTLEVNGLKLLNAIDGKGALISFRYDGILPAQANVKVYVGKIDGIATGDKIYLYHYNYAAGKLEEIPFGTGYVVDESGYISINIVHCSDYAALTKQAPENMVTSISDQIKVTPLVKTLYTEGTQSLSKVEIILPSTLERVNKLTDPASQSAIGAVTVTYIASDSKVVTVDADGKIKAVGKGKAAVTTVLKLYNGEIRTVKTTVTVKKPYISLDKSTGSMKVGSKFKFSIKAYGTDSSKIIWTTTKKSIVVIDKKTGIATAKSKGTDYVIGKIGKLSVRKKVVVK